MRDRITNIDAIRGFALFGILVVNIMAFSSVYYGSGFLPPEGRTGADAVLAFIISAVFELKFYLLFSFLFGYSVTLQMQSAEKAEAAFIPRILRRQAGLFLIGAVHAVVLFHGDILTTYAVLGLLLLALRNTSDAGKLRLAFVLVVSTAAFWLLMAGLQWIEPARDDSALFQNYSEAAIAAFRETPRSIIAQHLAELGSFLPILLLLQAPCALAMFLLGFVSGQRKFFESRERYGAYLGRALVWGLSIGLPGGLVYAIASQFMPGSSLGTAAMALSILTAPFLTLALMAAMLKLFDSGRANWCRDDLASAGRMALSNYLLQSLACALIFHGYGLGLIGRVSIAQTLIIAILIFGVQLLVSRWWLRRFRYGPLEWLLRAMTIGRWP
jgi:uncharacterized protein